MDIFERILKASELYDDNRVELNGGGSPLTKSQQKLFEDYKAYNKGGTKDSVIKSKIKSGIITKKKLKTLKETGTYERKIIPLDKNQQKIFNAYKKFYPNSDDSVVRLKIRKKDITNEIIRDLKKGKTASAHGRGGPQYTAPKGKVTQKELLKIFKDKLGIELKRSTLSSTGKRYNIQRPNYFVEAVSKMLNRKSTTWSKGRKGTLYYYFDKPNAAQLDFLGNIFDSPILAQNTVQNMKILHDTFGKKLANASGKDFFRKDLTMDMAIDALEKAGIKNVSSSQVSRAMTRLGQVYQGKLFRNLPEIQKNVRAGNFIFNSFNELDQYNPWRQGSYQAVLDDIDQALGKQVGNLSAFKQKFKEKMQLRYPDRKFNFNEIFSLSTSANRGSYPYAYFVDLTEDAMNKGALSSLQGKASIAEGKIQDNIIKYRRTGNIKFYNEAVRVADVYNNVTRKNFLDSKKVLDYEKKYGISPNAYRIEIGSQKQVSDKLNFAENFYKNSDLNKWKNLGIDIDAHTAKSGYIKTFNSKTLPKNVTTAPELFTKESRMGKNKLFDEKKLNEFLEQNKKLVALLGGDDCGRIGKYQGGRIGLQDGTPNVDVCFKKGIDRIRKGGVDFTRAEAMNFNKLTKGLRAVGASNIMKFGVLPEALFEGALIADKMVSEGDSFMQGIRNSYLSIPFQAMGAMKTYEEGKKDEILAAAPESQRGKVLDVMSMQDTLNKRNELAQDSFGLKKQIEDTDRISDGSFGYVSDSQDLQKRLSDKRMDLQDLYRGDAARAERMLTSSPLDLKIKDQLSMDAYNQAVEKADALRAANIKVAPGTGFGVDTQIKKRMQDEGILKADDVNQYLQYMGDTYGTGYTPLSLGRLFSMFGIQNPRFGFDETGKYNQERGINDVLNYMKMQNIADAGGVANLAGGGIAGLSGGVDKGPAPESGPASGGLLKLFKRVRNY